MFTNILEVKNKTSYRQVGADKSKRKAIKFGNSQWELEQKKKGNSKIDEHINKSFITELCVIHKSGNHQL